MARVSDLTIALVPNRDDHTYIATWGPGNVNEALLDHYEYQWRYATSDYGYWFNSDSGSASPSDDAAQSGGTWRHATRTPSDYEISIMVQVWPVAKTHKVNDVDVPYFTGEVQVAVVDIRKFTVPDKASTPSAEIDKDNKYKLNATVTGIEVKQVPIGSTDYGKTTRWGADIQAVEFEALRGNRRFAIGTTGIVNGVARWSCNLSSGGPYTVRARYVSVYGWGGSVNDVATGNRGEWSDQTDEISTIPTTPRLTSVTSSSSTAVTLKWTAASGADTYEIRYAAEKEAYLRSSDAYQSTSTEDKSTSFTMTGLDTGKRWWFMVRGVNDAGESEWSNTRTLVIGKPPAAPTTWSSDSTARVGQVVNLYWVHNARDESREVRAQVEITVGSSTTTKVVENADPEGDSDTVATHSYAYTCPSTDAEVKWRVRTMGVTEEYGAWSVRRTVRVSAPATLSLEVQDGSRRSADTVTSYPFYVYGLAGPSTQKPVGYHVSMTALASYSTTDARGNATQVTKGEEVYSTDVTTSAALLLRLTPASVTLQSGQAYEVTATVAMSSGLTATATDTFRITLGASSYSMDAEVAPNREDLTAYIKPVVKDSTGALAPNTTVAVYRLEYDGRLTEIASGIDAANAQFVTDPHPSLYDMRYRIVATNTRTGYVDSIDTPPYPMRHKSSVFNWDEEWRMFDAENQRLSTPPWTGSQLQLKGNFDETHSAKPDVSLVEYIGRESPVSYYGTQAGEGAQFSAEVPKSDKETLYQVRRLKAWMGDVYVRTPTGVGYWASVTVSYDYKHKALTVPVSMTVTRVEGGA